MSKAVARLLPSCIMLDQDYTSAEMAEREQEKPNKVWMFFHNFFCKEKERIYYYNPQLYIFVTLQGSVV